MKGARKDETEKKLFISSIIESFNLRIFLDQYHSSLIYFQAKFLIFKILFKGRIKQ